MDEQLRGAMAELITMLTKGAEGLYAFGQEQVPEVLAQLLMWKTVAYGFGTLIPLIFIPAYLTYLYKAVRGWSSPKSVDGDGRRPFVPTMWIDEDGDIRPHHPIMLIVGILPLLINFFWFCESSANFIQITLAPKVWLLEYATQLVK